MCYRKYGGGEYISGDRADSCKETTKTSCSSGDNEKKKTAKQQCFHPFTTKRWKSYTVCYREALKGKQNIFEYSSFKSGCLKSNLYTDLCYLQLVPGPWLFLCASEKRDPVPC